MVKQDSDSTDNTLVRIIKTLDHSFIGQMLENSHCGNFKKGVWRSQQIYSKNQVSTGCPPTRKDQVR